MFAIATIMSLDPEYAGQLNKLYSNVCFLVINASSSSNNIRISGDFPGRLLVQKYFSRSKAAIAGLQVLFNICWQITVYTCCGFISDIPFIFTNLKLGYSFHLCTVFIISSVVAVFPVPGIPEIYKLVAEPPDSNDEVMNSLI